MIQQRKKIKVYFYAVSFLMTGMMNNYSRMVIDALRQQIGLSRQCVFVDAQQYVLLLSHRKIAYDIEFNKSTKAQE